LSNLKFALAVEPGNLALQDHLARCTRLRSQTLPTLPVALQTERAINPFLRSRMACVAAAVRQRDRLVVDDVTTFAALRQWKNNFR
jgi:hydroxyacylglutathione hydrolase